jgi:hypothetical protein
VVRGAALPWLVVAGFVAISATFDRLTAGHGMTLHDSRPPLIGMVSLGLALIGWRRRDQLPAIGRVGVLLCVAGATANLICLVADHDGVSDYLDLEVRGLLLAFNIADLALLLGVSTVFASVIVRRLRRTSLGTSLKA